MHLFSKCVPSWLLTESLVVMIMKDEHLQVDFRIPIV